MCLLEQVTAKMREALEVPGCDALPIFMAAAVAVDDPEICRRALPLAAARCWDKFNPTREHKYPDYTSGNSLCSQLDVGAMPAHMLESLPTKYLVALGRAYAKRDDDKKSGSSGDWRPVQERFYTLITSCECSTSLFLFHTNLRS
jgi:hypothetical protein